MRNPTKPTLIRRLLKYFFAGLGVLLVLFLGLSLIPISATVEPIQLRESTQYWTLNDGSQIAYTKIEGDAAGENSPILFLHGGPGGYIHSSMIQQMEILAQSGYNIYLYDQIGSGLSDRLPRPKDYSFDRHVSDLKEIISTQIQAPKAILIGQSFGAMVAAHLIASDAALVEGVIFTSPAALQPLPPMADGRLINLEERYPTPENLQFREPLAVWEETERMQINPRIIMTNVCAFVFNCKWASDREMDDFVNSQAAFFTSGLVCDPANVLPEEGGGGGYAHIFSNWYVNIEDPRAQLKNANVPALVLQGQCDQLPYGYAFEYADLLNGDYVLIEGAGHEIWWEESEAFIAHITDFLEGIPR